MSDDVVKLSYASSDPDHDNNEPHHYSQTRSLLEISDVTLVTVIFPVLVLTIMAGTLLMDRLWG